MQSSVRRQLTVVGALAVVAMFGLGASAWACVPQGNIGLSPTSGPVGTNITVTGSNMTPDASVKVWWGGVGKELVATGNVGIDRAFKATFTVPASTAGPKIVSASHHDAAGASIGNPANAVFKVEVPGQTTPPLPANLQGERQNVDGSAALAVAEPAAAPSAPAASAAPARATSGVTATTAARATSAAAATQAAPAATPATQPAPAPAAAPAPEAAVSAQPAPAVAPPATQGAVEETSRRGTPGWALAGLALLSLGFIGTGTAIFMTERNRVRAKA